MQTLRVEELWERVLALADEEARASRRREALRVVRIVELWVGLPSFPDAEAPARTGREQVHLVRLDFERLGMSAQSNGQT